MKIQLFFLIDILAAFFLSAVVSVFAVRKMISFSQKHSVFDEPDQVRKIHGPGIASLGGVGVFAGYCSVAVLCVNFSVLMSLSFIFLSTIILFFAGIYDDLKNMKPVGKLAVQVIATTISVVFAGNYIDYGAFFPVLAGVPIWCMLVMSIIVGTFFINSFNFIDGIDGLACIAAVLYVTFLGGCFLLTGQYTYTIILMSLLGALLGLSWFNLAPARIYMGDTGSMFLGFTIFTFAQFFLKYFQSTNTAGLYFIHSGISAMLVIFSLLFLPVYDALRVFATRLIKGRSPFAADRAHLHYYLVDAGFSHTQAVMILILANLCMLFFAIVFQDKILLVLAIDIVIPSVLVTYALSKKRLKNILPI